MRIRWFHVIIGVLCMALLLLFWQYRTAGQELAQARKALADAEWALQQEQEAALQQRLQERLDGIVKEVRSLAGQKLMREALTDFAWAFPQLAPNMASTLSTEPLKSWYKKQSIPTGCAPQEGRALYLQSFYMAGQKQVGRNHPYHYIPEYYEADLEQHLSRAGSVNAWLLNRQGQVVFAVVPDLYFGIDLQKPPAFAMAMAQVFQQMEGNDYGPVFLPNQQQERPDAPDFFGGAPVFKDKEIIGYCIIGYRFAALYADSESKADFTLSASDSTEQNLQVSAGDFSLSIHPSN